MNNYKLLDNSKIAFNHIFKKIKNAKKTIYLESYIISNDIIGKELIDILIKKSKEGIKVIVIVDDLGWNGINKERLKRLNESNIEFYIFNPWFRNFSWKNIKKYWNTHFRNHRKLTIIDSKYAYIGGMNYSNSELNWRDMMIEITGEIVKELISSSHEMLGICKKKNLKKRKIFKKLSKKFNGKDIIVRQIPYSKHRLLKKEIMKLIDFAKKEINIVTPYLIPDLPFRKSLRKAVNRGVKVKIIIPKKTDHWIVDKMNHFVSYLSEKFGMNVFLYPKMIHSKYILIDKNICSFGSANMDYQSFNHNYELNIISNKKTIIKALKKSFKKDISISFLYNEKKWSEKLWINKIIMNFLFKYRNHF